MYITQERFSDEQEQAIGDFTHVSRWRWVHISCSSLGRGLIFFFSALRIAVAISLWIFVVLSADVIMLIEGYMIAMSGLLTTLRWLLELCHGTLMSGIMPLDLAKHVPVQVVLAKNNIELIFCGLYNAGGVGKSRDLSQYLATVRAVYAWSGKCNTLSWSSIYARCSFTIIYIVLCGEWLRKVTLNQNSFGDSI